MMGLRILTNFMAPGEVAVSVADAVTGVDHGSLKHIFDHPFRPDTAKYEPLDAIRSFPRRAIAHC